MDLENKNTNTILDSIAEAVVTIDKKFKITFINEAAKRITGFKKDEAIGTYCKHFFESEFCETNCPIVSVIKTGNNIYDRETVLKCNEDNNIPIKLNAAVLRDEQGKPTGGVISFRDISRLKKFENALESENIYYGIIGKSKTMRKIFELVEEISDTNVAVLISGATGTGKELIANAIQKTSLRKDKTYIKINCSAIPSNLISSELFGHVKGAFTDAREDRIGRFELADGGTIFLDEIGDLSLEAQPQFLRFLQEGTFERLGDAKQRKSNVRIIAATNRNLTTAISDGTFREDLFYRLNVVHIELPPLKSREEDISVMINNFIKKYSLYYNRDITGIDDKSLELLHKWKYPGNVRELENIIEYAVIRTKNNEDICACRLPQPLRINMQCNDEKNVELADEIGTTKIVELLNEHRWNKTTVAKKLGIDRTTLWRRMKTLGIG